MVQYIFLHDGFDTLLFTQELSSEYESLTDYINWFIHCYPCLLEWKETMNWTMEKSEEKITIRCETKIEGCKTFCIRNTENEYTLHIPFLPHMTYYQLRTIFSLLLPAVELVFYFVFDDKYYTPKEPFVQIPTNSTECKINTTTYPLSIFVT